ncbi:MAG TPA: hypothetical protein VK831_05755 [Candidatus Deferrimicrobiaceae bacterium]|nr:hypothetical protein [Candidatus Deferrimicrobiaceae bacterium]
MELLHSALGYLTGAAVVVGMAWSLRRAVGRDPAFSKAWFDRFALATLAVVVAEVVTGAAWQSSGGDPAPEHALLAGVSVAAIPLLRILGASMGGFGRWEPWLWLATYAVVGGSLIGLFVSG